MNFLTSEVKTKKNSHLFPNTFLSDFLLTLITYVAYTNVLFSLTISFSVKLILLVFCFNAITDGFIEDINIDLLFIKIANSSIKLHNFLSFLTLQIRELLKNWSLNLRPQMFKAA